MLESLIITLREGVEAALVVGIVYAFLRKEGLDGQLRAVWAGLGAAVAASLAGAWVLHRVAVNEEAFEGVLYVVSAVVVGSMVVWMWRHARHVSGEIKGALSRIVARRSSGAVFAGVFLFTFLMVFREGVETALFLAAVSLTTSGLLTLLGALAGLSLAVWFGVLFIRGSVRLDLGRFFPVTGIALMIFVVQLLLNGYHELSEAGWLPASPASMAVVGPLVRYELFFIVAVLAIPLLAVALPGNGGAEGRAPSARSRTVPAAGRGMTPAPVPASGSAPNPAEQRLRRLEARRHTRTRAFLGTLGILILALLGLGFTYANTAEETPVEPLELAADGSVRLPLERLGEGELHRYAVEVDGRPVRFIAMRLGSGEVVAGFDACVICGPEGYTQQGAEVVCLHCSSAIYPPTIGRPGGCNPVPLEFEVRDGEVVVAAAGLAAAADLFGGAHHGAH
ncbi:MAG TPA: Fe-S-containing protein [Thermoanaerobaculia bacterium]|nr:Fe-S-containing protein [Thermoanaerobaculia bacterium]